MEDTCIICLDRLATVTPTCGHRQYCSVCFKEAQNNHLGSTKNCPICRTPPIKVNDTTTVQLREVTMHESLTLYDALRQDYPFGCRLFGNEEQIATPDVHRVVKEAMEAVQATRLNIENLKKALKTRLTVEQYQLVFVNLIENEDLHEVMKQLDNRKFERRLVIKQVKEMVVRTIESPDGSAVLSRAVLGTAGSAAFDLVTNGAKGFSSASPLACGVSNLFMFTIFTAVELYRWSKGLDGREVAKNIGEHAVGGLCGFGGSFGGFAGGAAVGAAVGSVVPVIGTAIGGIIGGILGSLLGGLVFDAAGRWVYRKVLPGKKSELSDKDVEEQLQLTREEIAKKAAEKFRIDFNEDSFEDAQARFRRRLLHSHPDKHPNATEEEHDRLTAETRDILACWLIVREYYKDRGDIEANDCEEGFIKACALKVKDFATNQWKTARTFFGNVKLDRDINPETERLEEIVIYI